ncbi:MAG: MFS transporter [Bacillota bacterium]
MEDGKGIDLPSRLRLIGFTLFSAIYFLSFFHDMAVPVVGDDLVSDLSLDASALGFMSSGFFVLYALTQPAIGLLSDRIGPERASAGALLIGALGSFLAVQADGFTFAFLGRIMMGTGLAAGFIPGMKLIAVMFRRKVFTTYNALFAGIGNLSCLVGTVPLTRLAAPMEWRQVFAGLGVVSVLLAGSSWAFARMRSAHTMSATGPEREAVSWVSLLDVLRNRPLWFLGFFLFMKYGSQAAFQGLWGIPCLSSVYQVDSSSAARAVTMIATGYVLGAPVMGWLADTMAARGMDLFVARMSVLTKTTICYVLTWTPIVLAPGLLPFPAMYVLLFIMGICASSSSLVFAVAKDLFPSKVSGFVFGLVSLMYILGGAMVPPVVGWFTRLLAAQGLQGGVLYSKALIPCLVVAALALAFESMAKEANAKPFGASEHAE